MSIDPRAAEAAAKQEAEFRRKLAIQMRGRQPSIHDAAIIASDTFKPWGYEGRTVGEVLLNAAYRAAKHDRDIAEALRLLWKISEQEWQPIQIRKACRLVVKSSILLKKEAARNAGRDPIIQDNLGF